jgi:hypothetical protein
MVMYIEIPFFVGLCGINIKDMVIVIDDGMEDALTKNRDATI